MPRSIRQSSRLHHSLTANRQRKQIANRFTIREIREVALAQSHRSGPVLHGGGRPPEWQAALAHAVSVPPLPACLRAIWVRSTVRRYSDVARRRSWRKSNEPYSVPTLRRAGGGFVRPSTMQGTQNGGRRKVVLADTNNGKLGLHGSRFAGTARQESWTDLRGSSAHHEGRWGYREITWHW